QIRERNDPRPESTSNWIPVPDRQRISKPVSIKHQRMCSFCHPNYLDDDGQIMGYIRKRSRELIVHRTSCPRLIDHNADQQSQLLPMVWQLQPPAFKVAFFLKGQDRAGLVLDITKVLYQHHCNLL